MNRTKTLGVLAALTGFAVPGVAFVAPSSAATNAPACAKQATSVANATTKLKKAKTKAAKKAAAKKLAKTRQNLKTCNKNHANDGKATPSPAVPAPAPAPASPAPTAPVVTPSPEPAAPAAPIAVDPAAPTVQSPITVTTAARGTAPAGYHYRLVILRLTDPSSRSCAYYAYQDQGADGSAKSYAFTPQAGRLPVGGASIWCGGSWAAALSIVPDSGTDSGQIVESTRFTIGF